MEITSFAAINKFQPFNVAVSSNVLFLLVCAPLPPCPLRAKGQAGAGGWGTWEVSLECQLCEGRKCFVTAEKLGALQVPTKDPARGQGWA